MEALLRKVDADFLAMIKEAEDDESKVNNDADLFSYSNMTCSYRIYDLTYAYSIFSCDLTYSYVI